MSPPLGSADLAVAALVVFYCGGWLRTAIRVAVRAGKIGVFEEGGAPAPASWPKLSVVIAARDEVHTLEPALASLRAQDYPNLEVILVDDRSTDGTAEVVDRLSHADPRLHVLHVTTLPGGWLGKVHALDQGTRQAHGDWLLFTDADVQFAPGSLRRAVALAEAEGLDHLALVPNMKSDSLPVNTAIAAFSIALLERVDLPRPDGRPTRNVVGVGGFNLVRQSVFAKTPGFAWLRLEIADDFALAQMIRDAGGKNSVRLAHRAVAVPWYPNLRAFYRGLNKNIFSTMSRFLYPLALAQLVVFASAFVVPWLGWFWPSPAWVRAAPLVSLAVLSLLNLSTARRLGWPALPFLLFPLGALLLASTIATSAWSCLRHGGVVWRDTVYRRRDLIAGQRVRL